MPDNRPTEHVTECSPKMRSHVRAECSWLARGVLENRLEVGALAGCAGRAATVGVVMTRRKATYNAFPHATGHPIIEG